jgi:hypothetical protein
MPKVVCPLKISHNRYQCPLRGFDGEINPGFTIDVDFLDISKEVG